MNRRHLVAFALADAFLAGSPDIEGLTKRAAWCLGRKHRWIKPLCRRAFQTFGSALAASDRRKVAEWIAQDEGFRNAWQAPRPPRIVHYFLDTARMVPRKGALAACKLPDLPTPADLAAWLGITIAELDWFADVRGMNPAEGVLSHYRYAWVPKRYGARLMEIPKPRLRAMQRKVLREILDAIPLHDAAHGFRQGRSCKTFVAPHTRQHVLLRMDLKNFFPSIPGSRIHALFTTLGYPEAVARTFTGLCTHHVPMSLARRGAASWEEAKLLGVPHLPQGAPTSPALANACALHLDLRLDALAQVMGARYTRYADDVAFSGGEVVRRRVARISQLVASIVLEEGFEVNHRKTRAMHRSDRQVLTGIVVNEKPNIRRHEFDRLKAILTNCLRHGPASQNREARKDFKAHLAGRIAHVASLNSARGARLDALFKQIDWRA